MSAPTTATAQAANTVRAQGAWQWLWWIAPALVLLAASPLLPAWMITVPEGWTAPFIDWVNTVVEFLRRHAFFGLFTFKDVTRFLANLINYPLDLVEGILITGFPDVGIASMPFVMIAGLAAVLGWWLKGPGLAGLAAGTVVYMAVFGKWKLSMITLSVVLVAAPTAGLIALGLGIVAFKQRWFEAILSPVLNVMQSLPHFSYLIPVAVFVGVGHKAGTIATILFAIPAMARLTVLGLRGVSSEVVEAGKMAGCSPLQMLWKVLLPAARPALLVGINQVIMQCLAMVVIAAFIGAKGLGHDLLFRLQSLRIGQAMENGLAIVFMAIALDRLSRAAVHKEPAHRGDGPLWTRYPFAIAAVTVIVVSLLLAWATPWAHTWPRAWSINMAPYYDAVVDWITLNLYGPLQIFRDSLLLYVLIPLRQLFQLIPWVALVALVAGIGWRLGGLRLAAITSGFVLFIAFAGFWPRSLITAYMVFFALLVCLLFGLPLGIWAAGARWRSKLMEIACDTFQTFPSFIYLIPVIMLFKVGDVAAISAIVIYAMIPIIRYTMFGLANVPAEIVEAGITSGCTRRQLLWNVRMPLAFPEIMLGVNQTIMFSLFMVIIAAFIGTKDLGQEIFRALTFNDAGKGLVIGLCVAFMGLAVDLLVTSWARQRKAALGLD